MLASVGSAASLPGSARHAGESIPPSMLHATVEIVRMVPCGNGGGSSMAHRWRAAAVGHACDRQPRLGQRKSATPHGLEKWSRKADRSGRAGAEAYRGAKSFPVAPGVGRCYDGCAYLPDCPAWPPCEGGVGGRFGGVERRRLVVARRKTGLCSGPSLPSGSDPGGGSVSRAGSPRRKAYRTGSRAGRGRVGSTECRDDEADGRTGQAGRGGPEV